MPVKVLYFAEFKEITKNEDENIELIHYKLKELIDLLIIKYPRLKELIWDSKFNFINSDISVILNNRAIRGENLLSTSLKDGDIITFLLPISGG
jgi:MoaD family protein